MSNVVALEVGVLLDRPLALARPATTPSTATLATLCLAKDIPNRRPQSSGDDLQLLLRILQVLGFCGRRQVATPFFPSVSTHYLQ